MEPAGRDNNSTIRYPIRTIEDDPRFLDREWLLERWTGSYMVSRNVLDIIGAMLLLIAFIISAPFIIIAIKIDSRGAVFYSQQRVGRDNQLFNVVKYRSMREDAELDGAQFASEGDPRVTRAGVLLRKSRLDELPQVINVLRGEMSIVGPRPERPHVIEAMSDHYPAFRMRTVVKPGLTGWAQVKGAYAANFDELVDKLEFDLYYIRNASIRRDINIVVGTIRVVVQQRGL